MVIPASIYGTALRASLRVLCVIGLLTAWSIPASGSFAETASWAAILTYNRLGDGGDSVNAVRIDQFEAHIAEILRGGYQVLPLGQIVAALKDGKRLPDKAIAITFDDAHFSIYSEAWPRLRRAGLPFTVFVATDTVDRGAANYMGWEELRELANAGVEIGNMTASHPHMPLQQATRLREEIANASRRIEEELGGRPAHFAYPYGEWSLAVRQVVMDSGFAAAFGQQSGVAYVGSDLFALPRFPMIESLASVGRFRLAADALPFKITNVMPADPYLATPPAVVTFTLAGAMENMDRLACFSSQAPGPMAIVQSGMRVELKIGTPLAVGRLRVNCTVPSADSRWYWLGLQFLLRSER